ncbi:hypothetical protein LJY25_03320 [Hymenobacter sp. BT175]|uniref:hypothetical protein n=1 Tax=Hymenobacter translucens TaxID=2886507 RepID=UPI001D0DC463|nr:hypothetical protein [Hymenobacter translucens]MCC2545461.1 hypothetical protein [Hymenobacter translucens]
MGKHKLLNGLPHNLVKSYFSTLNHYWSGYMADWLTNAARELKISEARIDILNEKLEPAELNIYPLLVYLKSLKPIIARNLEVHGFPPDFITEATIKVVFPSPITHSQTIYCYGYLVDQEGRHYESGRVIEDALEAPFNPFAMGSLYFKGLSFTQRIRSFLGLSNQSRSH